MGARCLLCGPPCRGFHRRAPDHLPTRFAVAVTDPDLALPPPHLTRINLQDRRRRQFAERRAVFAAPCDFDGRPLVAPAPAPRGGGLDCRRHPRRAHPTTRILTFAAAAAPDDASRDRRAIGQKIPRPDLFPLASAADVLQRTSLLSRRRWSLHPAH